MYNRGGEQKFHTSSRNAKVLVDSTNRRTATSRTSTNSNRNSTVMKTRPSFLSHQSSLKEDYTQNGIRRSSSSTVKTKTAPGLNDLLPQDKAKIARLVEQVMQLTNENVNLKEELDNAEEERHQCDAAYDHFKSEQQSLKVKRNDSLLLLRKYQDKIQFFSDELAYTRKAYDDLSQRYNSSQESLSELEFLVNNQRQTIEHDKNKHQVLLNSTKELQELKDELRHKTEDCSRYKSKSETLEGNSNYLASQLDGLLSQLTEKTNRIQILEDKIKCISATRNDDVDRHGHHLQCSTSSLDVPATTSTTLSEFVNSPHSSIPVTVPRSTSADEKVTNSVQSSSLQDTSAGLCTASTIIASPPPRKVHTPEQLLASWSEQYDGDEHVEVEGGAGAATGTGIDQKVLVSQHVSSTENQVQNTKNNIKISHGGVDLSSQSSAQAVKDNVAYNMSLDMSPVTTEAEKEKAENTHQTLLAEEGSIITSSMREASSVSITASPLCLTPPPRKCSDLHGKARENSDSFHFNDSSLDSSTIVKNASGDGIGSELTDEFFLETANRQFGHHHPESIAATGVAVTRPRLDSDSSDPSNDTRYSHHLQADEAPKRQAKRAPGKSTNKTNRSSTTNSRSNNISLMMSQKTIASQRKSTATRAQSKTKKSNLKHNNDSSDKIVKSSNPNRSSSNTAGSALYLPPASSPRNKKDASVTEESPGLKAWEEASKSFDGYGMQLFDLLDQIDHEGVHGSHSHNSLNISSVTDVDVRSSNNNSSDNSSSFKKLLDSSDTWM